MMGGTARRRRDRAGGASTKKNRGGATPQDAVARREPADPANAQRQRRGYARMAAGSTPFSRQKSAYASGETSDGLISLRPPQKTFV